ncbi:aminoacylase-1A-like [Contarinia nasturtii]|uniref:aminoacylase-1A-like n=1 Tax=Contarinia nasturtii TaxID=265458 RepID=UPI0012D428EE|nr:aminoacylase-1A-like [Contarinia nasturtii]
METDEKPSCVSRYICNIKFFAFICICLGVILGILYYPNAWKLLESIGQPESENEVKPIDSTDKPKHSTKNWDDDEEINILREYLRIPSVHPNIDYEPCVEFLTRQAKSLDLPMSVYYPVNDKNPVVVITWDGLKPELSSIMLNSHMDVVPVYEKFWTHPPFAAEIDENGDIFARGSLDMKSIGMQYLAAIRALKRQGVKQMNRTVHVIFVPDEEMGGMHGMYGFIQSEEFKALNIGFMLDEGGGIETTPNELGAYYSEKTAWMLELIFHGHSGHGSKLFNDTVGEKLSYVVNKFMEFRFVESWKLNVLRYPIGQVTSINLTILKGGTENNVIPPEMNAIFDIRHSVDADLDEFEKQVEQWCEEAGGNITINYIQKGPKALATPIDDTNPFWQPLLNAVTEFNLKVTPQIMFATTDSRFIRSLNIPAIGFNAYVNSTLHSVHGHNEFLNADIYLFGIDVYKKIIEHVTNV